MKIFAVICEVEDTDKTLEWITNESDIHLVKVEKFEESLKSVTYSSGWNIILIRIMDEEAEMMMKLKYPSGTFIGSTGI